MADTSIHDAMAADLEITRDYKQFDADSYLKTYYSVPPDQGDGHFLKFALDSLHSAFQSGNIKRKSLLDIGTGPSFHTVISASRCVDDIYLSDFTEQNRKILNAWWKDSKIYEQHTNVLKYVLNLENSSDTVEDRNKYIKQKVRNIVPIDVMSPQPLQSIDVPQIYDVITSSLCLESPTSTKEEYETAVRNISPLLKQNGFLILVGSLNLAHYPVGKFKFQCAKLTKEEIQSIYENVGYNIKLWKVLKHSECVFGDKSIPLSEDYEVEFFIVAQKM